MSRPLFRLVLAASMALLAACGGDAGATTTTGTATTTAPPTSRAETTTTTAPSTTTTTTAPTTTAVTGTVVEIVVRMGQVAEGGGRVAVPLGEEVTLLVTSDLADEVHVHGYDLTLDLEPGVPATLVFTADIPGIFEVELHDSGLLLASLQVGG